MYALFFVICILIGKIDSVYLLQHKVTTWVGLRTGPMKWPQRWVAAFVVTLPAGKGKGKGKVTTLEQNLFRWHM